MGVIDQRIVANANYFDALTGARPKEPRLELTVVACMDARLALFGALGLQIGDAHLIRNAGGIVTDDVLRSLALSQHKLGTREVMIVQHTDCGMLAFDDEEFRRQLYADSGELPSWDVPGFTDVEASVRTSVQRVKDSGWIPHRDSVRGFVFDVSNATITEVH
jgi:carbonic anhydrase